MASNIKQQFDANLSFTSTLPPDPDWKPGQGVNRIGQEQQRQNPPSSAYTLIEPGVTDIETRTLYRVMLGGISPRPIALVGTYAQDGTANLAPVSWYQMVSQDPPLVMLSFGGMRERIKDSEQNIMLQKQFCISSCTEAYAEAVNHAAINAPTGTSEFFLTGLTPKRGVRVNAPRVQEAPFAMELELDFDKRWSNAKGDHTTTLIIGRVKMIHVRNDVKDANGFIDPEKLRPISRFSGTTYGRSVLGYDIPLPRWDDEYKDQQDVQALLRNTARDDEKEDEIDACVAKKYP